MTEPTYVCPECDSDRVTAEHHHTACAQCRDAGASPNTQQRCPEGAQLWGTYQQAGDPPHFTWLNKRQRGRKP